MADDINREAPDLVSAGVQTLVESAQRLGLTWGLRLATVQAAESVARVTANYDGDKEVITMISLIGLVQPGSRVMVIRVPPAGNFIISSALGDASRELIHRYWRQSTADVTLTGTAQLVPGTQVTVTGPGTFEYEVIGFFDFDETVAGGTLCIGELFINGAAVTGNALFQVTTVDDRATVGQSWVGTTRGGSVMDIRVRRSAAAGTQIARSIHTSMLLKVYQ